MTQFKEKCERREQPGALVSAGLFFYPVLMAADVLAYRADEVPVGDDQRQHVELMREIARRFNERFGEILVEPEHRIPEVGARIMDLQEPDLEDVDDRRDRAGHRARPRRAQTVRKKFKSAVTDSGSEVRARRGQGGDREPDRDPLRRPRRPDGGRSRPSSRAPATATSRARWPRRSSSSWRRCASATRSCAPTRRRSRRPSPPAPRRRARSPLPPSPTCARRWASARRACRWRRAAQRSTRRSSPRRRHPPSARTT